MQNVSLVTEHILSGKRYRIIHIFQGVLHQKPVNSNNNWFMEMERVFIKYTHFCYNRLSKPIKIQNGQDQEQNNAIFDRWMLLKHLVV